MLAVLRTGVRGGRAVRVGGSVVVQLRPTSGAADADALAEVVADLDIDIPSPESASLGQNMVLPRNLRVPPRKPHNRKSQRRWENQLRPLAPMPSIESAADTTQRPWPGMLHAAYERVRVPIPAYLNTYCKKESTCPNDMSAREVITSLLESMPRLEARGLTEAKARLNGMPESVMENGPLLAAINQVTPHVLRSPTISFQRTVVFHGGDRHSSRHAYAFGKLVKSRSGVFSSDCPVQAAQAYSFLMERGVACNLLIPETKRTHEGAQFVACTHDMLDMDTLRDCAVIENADTAADSESGSDTTRALQRVPCKYVHILGEVESFPLVQQIASACGDRLLARYHEVAVCKLTASGPLLHVLSLAKRGDVIAARTAKAAIAMRADLPGSAAVIYRGMPLQTMVSEVRCFVDGEADFLVADARVLGENALLLPSTARLLVPDEVERHPSLLRMPNRFHEVIGSAKVIETLKGHVQRQRKPLMQAGVFPTAVDLEEVRDAETAKGNPVTTVGDVLAAYKSRVLLDESRFRICDTPHQERLARLLAPFSESLTFRQIWQICNVPTRPAFLRNLSVVDETVVRYASRLVTGVKCLPPPHDPMTVTDTPFFREKCESLILQMDIYRHFAAHFPNEFPDLKMAVKSRMYLVELLTRHMAALRKQAPASKHQNKRHTRRTALHSAS